MNDLVGNKLSTS